MKFSQRNILLLKYLAKVANKKQIISTLKNMTKTQQKIFTDISLGILKKKII